MGWEGSVVRILRNRTQLKYTILKRCVFVVAFTVSKFILRNIQTLTEDCRLRRLLSTCCLGNARNKHCSAEYVVLTVVQKAAD